MALKVSPGEIVEQVHLHHLRRGIRVVLTAALCIAPASIFAGPLQRNVALPQLGASAAGSPVQISVGGWKLHGTFLAARGAVKRPAALLLNKANGNRKAYEGLATELAHHGISSLRLDLRGHGDSINMGRFIPGADDRALQLDGSWRDVTAALTYLRQHPLVDSTRVAVVGASYSGETMVEAARATSFVQAYVALSPGSFSEESARGIDASGAKWLLVRSSGERSPSVKASATMVESFSKTAAVWTLTEVAHATDLLDASPTLVPRLAAWLAAALAAP